jgi:hypothetical protein
MMMTMMTTMMMMVPVMTAHRSGHDHRDDDHRDDITRMLSTDGVPPRPELLVSAVGDAQLLYAAPSSLACTLSANDPLWMHTSYMNYQVFLYAAATHLAAIDLYLGEAHVPAGGEALAAPALADVVLIEAHSLYAAPSLSSHH